MRCTFFFFCCCLLLFVFLRCCSFSAVRCCLLLFIILLFHLLLQLVFSCGPCWQCPAGQAALLLALGDELVDGRLVDDELVCDGLKVGGRGGGVLLVGWRLDGGWW